MESLAAPGRSVDYGESEIDISQFIVPQVLQKVETDSTSSSEHFFQEDLVWPDPDNVFSKPSGIKPAVLTAELKHLNVGGMELQPMTRCQNALIVRKRPRPKSLPWNVVIIESDPPVIEPDDVEEYLVHDPLFVEFFNAFLALPSFPEAVYFNIESGGFEVVTDGKLRLAQQIKEAVRSQNTKVDIYETVHQHAFTDIPVVPIEDAKGLVQEQIETMFDVTALNKEQGIVWVKAARLPKFLESDYYFQYRLAKVISQTCIFNEKGEFVVMKIDYTTRPKTKKKAVEVQPPTQEELIMKQMFVSFGDLKGAAKEAWYNQVKKQLRAELAFSSCGGHLTAGGDAVSTIKPNKKSSVFNSQYFGVYSPGLIGPYDPEPPIHDNGKIKESMQTRERPFTPRPSDRIHAATAMLRAKLSKDPNADEEMVPAGHVVFVWPKQDLQKISTESDLEDTGREAAFAKRIKEQQIIDQIYNDGSWEEGGTGNIVLGSVDELGSVIVGAVMKKTVAEMLAMSENVVVADPVISAIYPSKDLACVSVDKLHLCVVAKEQGDGGSETESSSVVEEPKFDMPDKEPVHIKWSKKVIKPAEEDPEEESLLDSDEDFEERDEHFRRNQNKWHSLTSMKGIQAFKKFLRGTQGEKYWELWIAIDKGRLIRNEEEKQKYILHMRDTFYKKGSQFELSAENRRKLDLEQLSQWVPEHLFHIQARVLEPLVLYWAPRYLLRNLIHTNPEKYYLYSELKAAAMIPASDPYPHTQELLPLRPKSCCPRNRLGQGAGEPKDDNVTTPMVGNRRVYGKDTIERLAKTSTAKYLRLAKLLKRTPKAEQQLNSVLPAISPHTLSRIGSAVSETTNLNEELGRRLSVLETASVLSQDTPTPTLVGDSRKFDTPADVEKVPCPYKSVTAILQGQKRGLSGGIESRKSKNLLLPLVKTAGDKDQKCASVKSKIGKKFESQGTTKYTFFRQDSRESQKSCDKYQGTVKEGRTIAEDAEMDKTEECEFLGSERLELMLQALHHEEESGKAFRKFIEKTKKKDWLNNLDFWEKVQEYRKLFYKDKLDLPLITKDARLIFAQCIVEGAPQGILIPEHVKVFILDHLNPPYEDLFDRAEEIALKILFEAFQIYLTQDVRNYCEVERAIIKRRLETRNTNILDLQKQGIIKERPLTPDDPMEGYVDPVYDDSVLARVPEQFKNWNMDKLAQNKLELEYFRQFLIPRFAEIDLKCWMDMEAWRRTAPTESALRDQRAIEIKKNYLNKKYFFGPNSPAGKDGQNKVMEVGGGWGKFLEDKPHFNSILKAQKYVGARLENKHLPFFLLSRDFQERHLIDSSMLEDDEDVFHFQRKRSLAVTQALSEGQEAFESVLEKKEKLFEDLNYWTDIAAEKEMAESSKALTGSRSTLSVSLSVKSLEYSSNRWIASAREIFLLQRALKNPAACAQFKKFVSLSGGFLENDILFWLEVQKYKKLHKEKKEDIMLQRKINAIMNCFINSYLPPSLQINITEDMVTEIMENKNELPPNLFRKAQLHVFRGLLPHWVAFREYHRRLMTEEKVLSTLDRHRAVALGKEQKYREKLAQDRELERQMILQQAALQEEMDEEARMKSITFAKSQLLREEAMDQFLSMEDITAKGTQTIRGIPQYPSQPIEERPGYVDDPEVEEAAKQYSIVDYILYREYLKLEEQENTRPT